MADTSYQAAATAIVPEFEEALKSIEVEIDTTQDPEKVEKERSSVYKAIREVEKNMKEAAKQLDFERAAELRDVLFELRASSRAK